MHNTPQKLPPYRALLTVDVKNFSGEKGADHAELTESIPKILRKGFERCDLGELWDDQIFWDGTGDGYVMGSRSEVLPFLLNPFLPALQAELAERNANSQRLIRMRATINVGPMAGVGGGLSAGSGVSRVENHRLLDDRAVRGLLERSGPSTCVGAIVSERAFQDAVVPAYSGEDPDLYVKVRAKEKGYQGTAYLRVPNPSGDLLREGFVRGEEPEPDPADDAVDDHTAGDASGPNYIGTHTTSIQMGNGGIASSGGIHNSSVHTGDSSRGER